MERARHPTIYRRGRALSLAPYVVPRRYTPRRPSYAASAFRGAPVPLRGGNAMARLPRLAVPAVIALLVTTGCASTRDHGAPYLHLIRPDQRPPIGDAYAAGDSLFGQPEAGDRGDGIAGTRRSSLEALVRRFAPTLVLPSGDASSRNGRNYQLVPTDPLLFGRLLQVDRIAPAPYGLSSSSSIPLASSERSLARLVVGDEYAIRRKRSSLVLDSPESPGLVGFYDELRAGPDSDAWAKPTVWENVRREADRRRQLLVLDPFNDSRKSRGTGTRTVVSTRRAHREMPYSSPSERAPPQRGYVTEIDGNTRRYVGGRARDSHAHALSAAIATRIARKFSFAGGGSGGLGHRIRVPRRRQ